MTLCSLSFGKTRNQREGADVHTRHRPVGGQAILLAEMTFAVLTPAVVLGFAPVAGAEEALVRGMGRTTGWVVATEDGGLRFRDCQGQTSAIESARIEATTEHCRDNSRRIDLVGTLRRLDTAGRFVVETPDGQLHSFYIDTGRPDTPAFAGLAPGQGVRVTGPVAGRATGLTPQ
jgi:hypothetical protein